MEFGNIGSKKYRLLIVLYIFIWLQIEYIERISALKSCTGVPVEYSNVENSTYIIGGMFPMHFLNSHKKYQHNIQGIVWIEAMLFVIDEINKRTDLLPNASLGYRIFDSCNTIGIAIEAALQLINGQLHGHSSQTCPCSPTVDRIVGLVGDAASATTAKVASLLSASNTPQISYSATSTDLSQKHLFPSFMRTIPPDNFQAILITDLMLTYQWKYINVVACDDLYGRVGVDELLPQLKRHEICVAVLEVFDVKNDDGTHTRQIVRKLKQETQATVIILWCQRPEALKVLQAAQDEKLYHRTWIGTETYGSTPEVYEFDHKVVSGMFGIIPAQVKYKPFEDILKDITPNNSQHNNPWLEEYWVNNRKCKKITDLGPTPKYNCPDKNTDLTKLPLNKYVNVIDAVYAIAYGLHKYLENENATAPVDISVLNDYVRNINFTGKGKTTVSFNRQGNPAEAMYFITNVHYNVSTKILKHVEVGSWNYRTRKISFQSSNRVQFANSSNTTPLSSCTEICIPGYYGLRFGDNPCCWICVACPDGEVQPESGRDHCIKCTDGMISNNKRTLCGTPKHVYLDVTSAIGVVIVTFMVVAYIIIGICAFVFFIKRHTPIVKASNQSLSMLQIVSVLLQLAMPVFYFQKECTTELCGATLFYFVFFNIITISVTFTKADHLLNVFRQSKSGKLAGHGKTVRENTLQYFKVFCLTIVGLALCTILYLLFKPEIASDIKHDNVHGKIVRYCGGYYDQILFVLVAYIATISLLCSIYAFKARKLPYAYNEARFTSFAMFTFLLIWTMAVPIYFSRTDKVDKYASWCLLCCLSTMAIFIPMYIPKVYIILWKPEENTVRYFRENITKSTMKHHGLSISSETSMSSTLSSF